MSSNEKKIYNLKVTLMDVSPGTMTHPFCVVLVDPTETLYNFTALVLEQFGREFSKAFGFYSDSMEWQASEERYEMFADIDPEESPGVRGVKATPLDEAFTEIGKSMLLLYDYGEELRFYVELQKIIEKDPGERYPVIEDAFGQAPVEGGDPVPGELQENMSTAQDRHYYELEKEALLRVAAMFRIADGEEMPRVNLRTLETFYDYLLGHVKFPYEGVYSSQAGEEQSFHNVEVVGFVDPDETDDLDIYGIMGEVIISNQPAKMPVAEIVINQGDPNYNFIEDYCIWFWNNRSDSV